MQNNNLLSAVFAHLVCEELIGDIPYWFYSTAKVNDLRLY